VCLSIRAIGIKRRAVLTAVVITITVNGLRPRSLRRSMGGSLMEFPCACNTGVEIGKARGHGRKVCRTALCLPVHPTVDRLIIGGRRILELDLRIMAFGPPVWVYCPNCDGEGPLAETPEEAAKKWNSRRCEGRLLATDVAALRN